MSEKITRRAFLGLAALVLTGSIISKLEKEKIWQFTPLADYSPKTTTKRIQIDPNYQRALEQGLDAFSENPIENKDQAINPGNQKELRRMFLEDVEARGYSLEKLTSLSPKESAELVCDITSTNFDYLGSKEYRGILEDRAQLITRLKSAERELTKQKGQQKKQTQIYIENAKKSLKDIDNCLEVDSLSSAFILTFINQQSDRTLEEIYREKPDLICTDYARLAVGVFDVLKKINPNLTNSYLSIYANAKPLPVFGHAFNQLTTVVEEGNNILFVSTFVDPSTRILEHRDRYTDKYLGEDKSKIKREVEKLKSLGN